LDEQPLEESPKRGRRQRKLEAAGVRGIGGDLVLLRLVLEAVEDAVDVLTGIRDDLDLIAEIREGPNGIPK